MPIAVMCACGKRLLAKDELAGRRARCPACGNALTIPALAGGDASTPAPRPLSAAVVTPRRSPAPPTPPSRIAPPPPAGAEPDQDAPADAEPSEPARPKSSPRDYLYLILVLALVPLALSLSNKPRDEEAGIEERFVKTVKDAPPEVGTRVRQLLKSGNASKDELLAALPDGKLDGALLPRKTWTHWLYAAFAAGGFFAFILVIFPRGAAGPGSLLTVGLFTGTVGILFLLAVQYIAAWTQGIWIKGSGLVTILFYIVKFIGFSYRSALDADTGFFLSFLGFTCGVGLCEELCKALPLVWHYRRSATLPWRGACLWGLATGVGFGVAEGITYASDFYNGIQSGEIYVVRFVSCVALHAVWSAAVGITLFRRQRFIQGSMEWYEFLWEIVKILLVAMVLHGLYDTMLKKDMEALALATALASFGWLAWSIERIRREEARAAAPA